MRKLRWLAILMGITILGITGFQGYWLKNNYDREKQNLEIKTATNFRQAILQLQSSKLKLEDVSISLDPNSVKRQLPRPIISKGKIVARPKWRKNVSDTFIMVKEPPITMINLIQEKMRENGADSGRKGGFIITTKDGFKEKIETDSLAITGGKDFHGQIENVTISTNPLSDTQLLREIRMNRKKKMGEGISYHYKKTEGKNGQADSVTVTASNVFVENHDPSFGNELFEKRVTRNSQEKNSVVRFLYNIDSLSTKDSVTVKEIQSKYTDKLRENNIRGLSFSVSRLDSTYVNSEDPNVVTIGFAKPMVFGLSLENKVGYLLKKLTLPILFSIFLVGITVVSFVLLYRNLVKQRRLAELKNDFISNITHELKTPIATVGVAIEALKSFNAIHDPKRTQEYLDISQSELQRLSLLVDKVLKLSMFEKKEMELKKEQFDCKQLVEEVMTSMRLQFEKYHAKVKLNTEGENFYVNADKLHITSVIYNLLDNALKYSKEDPVINVSLKASPERLELSVSDNGIGIESAYKEKIFDKFFRVPTGNKHNTKGYGLGLSYVAEVIKRHQGHVYAESELGKGSTFTATFPHAG